MLISVMQSKLSYATVTQTELYYVGSITIDSDWITAAGLRPNQEVHVVNLNNGERFSTYVIPATAGSKMICLNGPAARRGMIGDQLFIISYVMIDPEKESIEPVVIDCRNT